MEKYLAESLLKFREWNDVNNVMDLRQKWNRTPMTVVQRLNSSMVRHCMAALGVDGGHTKLLINDVTFMTRPL